MRQPRRPGFEPSTLVETVMTYADDPLQQFMVRLVDEYRAKLVPWAA